MCNFVTLWPITTYMFYLCKLKYSRYYSDSYFPIDESGFGAEGQTDCMGTLHNFA